MAKTKQILIFLPEMATYKRRRQYKCIVCGKKGGCKEEDHQMKVFIEIFPIKIKF
ncbi:hypothetical protein EMGBD3_10810 [Nitrosarchaeum sp.]|nr:hypothetical protein EMGBD3_10810 [Nitrosarchaeum sp.]